MGIYSIGEEKCIDGVWGRAVGNRFYNFISSVTSIPSEGGLSRKIFIDSVHQFYAVFVDDGFGGHEYMLAHPDMKVKRYLPKPIELKRGDIVWVTQTTKSNKEVWSPVVYLSTNPNFDGFCCNEVFDNKGTGIGFTARVYKEVFLKPPFNL